MGRPRQAQSEEQAARRKRLTDKAKSAGWTVSDVARKAEIPRATLQQWWGGKRALDAAAEARVVGVLDGRPSQRAPPESSQQPAADAAGLRDAARALTGEALEVLAGLMRDSKSDTVRQRAAEVIIERAHGRTAKGETEAPRQAPATDRDLLAALERVATKAAKPTP